MKLLLLLLLVPFQTFSMDFDEFEQLQKDEAKLEKQIAEESDSKKKEELQAKLDSKQEEILSVVVAIKHKRGRVKAKKEEDDKNKKIEGAKPKVPI